jgi:hypothetical protein
MTSRVFDVSFRNEARRVTMNDNTKIGTLVQKSIGIYDLNVDDITGIYFIDVDNQEVFLHDHAFTKFFETIAVLMREYPYVTLFTITTSRHLRTTQSINKFRRECKRFIASNQSNNRVFFDRPYMNVTNNYYGGQTSPDMILNQLNTPITYYRAEMYVTNNYFNDATPRPSERYSQSQSQPQPQPQPQPQSQPQPQPQPQPQTHSNQDQPPHIRMPEPDIINRIFNNPTNNANNIEIELNYLYNPERGRFNIIQYPARNNIIDYIYNIITTTNLPAISEETINQLRRGTYNNLREHIIPECTQCTISLEDFSDTTEVIVLPCRHAFTADGIRTWLQTNTTCPTCRGNIVPSLTNSPIG